MALEIRPIHLKQANEWVKQYHRHNIPTVGGKFAVSCYDGERLCGVAICGRPTASQFVFCAFVCKRAEKQWLKRDIANGTTIIQNQDGKFQERLMKLHIGHICPSRRKGNDYGIR